MNGSKPDSPVIDNSNQSAEQAALSFEQAAARIEEIVRLLERGDAPLDESLALFEEGAKLIGICGKTLDEAEQIVVRLQKNEDGSLKEVEFDEG